MRGMVAGRMVESLQTAAQLTHRGTAVASALIAEKAGLAEAGTKVSVKDLLVPAVVRALKSVPDANGRVEGREIRLSAIVDLSVAIALPGNLLLAPAMFDAEKLGVAELRAAGQDLASRARAKKPSVTEMTGGIFTASHLGLTRVEHFTTIINAPQIRILGIDRMTDRAVRAPDGGIELRPQVWACR